MTTTLIICYSIFIMLSVTFSILSMQYKLSEKLDALLKISVFLHWISHTLFMMFVNRFVRVYYFAMTYWLTLITDMLILLFSYEPFINPEYVYFKCLCFVLFLGIIIQMSFGCAFFIRGFSCNERSPDQ